MDQKQTNRLILSICVVPVILFVLHIVLARLIGFAFIWFSQYLSLIRDFRPVFYLRYAVLTGAGLWMVLYAYVFVRYGEFKLGRIKFGRKE
jgi:hypothetical protein